MTLRLRTFLSRLSFRQQLALTFAIGIACLTIASSIGITKVTQKLIYQKTLDEGRTLTQSFALQATLPLLFQSQDSAKDSAQVTLAFPSVTGIAVLTPEKKVLYSQGVDTSTATLIDTGPNSATYHTEDEQAWYFSQPVYAGEDEVSPFSSQESSSELVGYVQVSVSKEALTTINSQILTTNLVIAFSLAGVLLLLLLAITNRVAKPLGNLAADMKLAEEGQTGVRAQLKGPKDVINMVNAFNSMMDELESRQDELKRARDTALASAKIKGEFATTVSHELRTPMNGVMGMLELLSTMDLDNEQIEYLEIARSSGESLLQLIDDILDFSKFESGALKLQSSTFDPRDMLRGIIELLAPQADQKNLTLEGEIDHTLPPVIVGDSGRIRQILVNLIGNALKFTSSGHVKVQITPFFDVSNTNHTSDIAIEKETDGNRQLEKTTLNITVTDTGIGIAPKAQHLIFEAFSQADSSTTREYGGTGLGLAICQQLVQLMGGNIGVRSRVDEGSTFWFTVPVAISKEKTLTDNTYQETLPGTHVLIVSGATKNSHRLLQLFSNLECSYRHTTSEQGALELLDKATAQGKSYDFVVLDFDGNHKAEWALFEQIQKNPAISTIKTIMLSPANNPNLPSNCQIMSGEINAASIQSCMRRFSQKIEPNLNTLPIATQEQVSTTEQVAVPSQHARILIVEDNETNQIVAKKLLASLGYRYGLAENGDVAIQKLETEHYDLVLMDCYMPVMNGYSATQLIRRKSSAYQHIPIIALTANTGPIDYDRCFSSGMNDCLAKPADLNTLNEKISYWLGNSKLADRSYPNAEQVVSTESMISKNSVSAIRGSAPIIKEASYQGVSKNSAQIESIHSNTFLSLKAQLGSKFDMLISSYLQDTPKHLQRLNKSIETNDWNQIKCIAHVVKGSSANIGAKRLLYLCQDIEDFCVDECLEQVKSVVREVISEFKIVEHLLINASNNQPLPTDASENSQRILVVDDNPNSSNVLRITLEKDGYLVKQTASAAEAISSCHDVMPDLILMEANMPQMDGITACKKILALECEVHPAILIITDPADEGSIERSFSAGATDYISKPINTTVLMQRVSRLLHSGDANRHIRQLSYYDHLTSLPNRSLFLERGHSLITKAEQQGHKVAILFMDLDRFKIINETLGHEAGDLLLKTFSQRLESCVRNADLVARLGGDEFAILFDSIHSADAATKAANKIVESLSGPFSFMQQQLHITTSIGIALYPDNGQSINELMKYADTAMFRAKAGGGNSYQMYTAGMETEIAEQMEMETEIQRALENDEFVLFYQPQVDLQTDQVTGCEALIRWQHPTKGLLAPFTFIPFAERTGFINKIGNWVLNRACCQLREWLDHDEENTIPIAVNVSGKELTDNILLEKVSTALHQNNIPSRLLKLEITEDTLVDSDESTTERLNDLRDLGVMLAIDDFGTGYSSLNYLKSFPVDTLKIDRSFVQDVPDDANSDAIINGIIALGHSLKLKIIAEGIETEEQRAFLRDKGCDIMQGYLLSKPLPVDEFEKWVENHNNLRDFILTKKTSSRPAQPPFDK